MSIHIKLFREFKLIKESIQLSDITDGNNFKKVYLVPNKFYKDKGELEESRLIPKSIKKEEGYSDKLLLVNARGDKKEYTIEDGVVSDLISYEEALKKLN